MTERVRIKVADLAQKQIDALERAEQRRLAQQQAYAAERQAFHDEAEQHRLRALARWHDGALLQRARLREAIADIDHHRGKAAA